MTGYQGCTAIVLFFLKKKSPFCLHTSFTQSVRKERRSAGGGLCDNGNGENPAADEDLRKYGTGTQIFINDELSSNSDASSATTG